MKNRVFTPQFKLDIVKASLSGEKSIVQLCREYKLSDSLIHNWRKLYLYRDKGEAAFTAPTYSRTASASNEHQEVRNLKNKVAELERFIGQQAVELSVFKKSRK